MLEWESVRNAISESVARSPGFWAEWEGDALGHAWARLALGKQRPTLQKEACICLWFARSERPLAGISGTWPNTLHNRKQWYHAQLGAQTMGTKGESILAQLVNRESIGLLKRYLTRFHQRMLSDWLLEPDISFRQLCRDHGAHRQKAIYAFRKAMRRVKRIWASR